MSTKQWTEAEWRAFCAREWPHLHLATATRALVAPSLSPLETKALARGAALEARIAELESRLHALERRRR